jgi:hypothetical protein
LKGISNGKIFHYTNYSAFKKIIKSGKFLLSSYRDLEDSDELVWAVNYYIDTIRHFFPKYYNFQWLPEGYYIFCACIRNNNKYLWDKYASKLHGDNSGIVLEINAEAFYNYYSKIHRRIDMTLMEYNTEAFKSLCQHSAEGLKPIAFSVMAKPNPHSSRHEREKFLNSIPGYKEFRAQREPVIRNITFQKGAEFSKEEEIRVLHWQEIHTSLEILSIGKKKKAILPWRFGNGHLINAVIRSNKCSFSEQHIKQFLDSNGIQTEIRTLTSDIFQ